MQDEAEDLDFSSRSDHIVKWSSSGENVPLEAESEFVEDLGGCNDRKVRSRRWGKQLSLIPKFEVLWKL